MKLPFIEKNKLGLVCCEKSTGTILNLNWTISIRNKNIPLRIFNSKYDIIEFIEKVKNDNIEFLIYDHNHNLTEFIY